MSVTPPVYPGPTGPVDEAQARAAIAFQANVLAKKETWSKRRVAAGKIGAGILLLAGNYFGFKAISDMETVHDTASADGKTMVREIDTHFLTDVSMTAVVDKDGKADFDDSVNHGVSGISDTFAYGAGLVVADAAVLAGAHTYNKRQKAAQVVPVAPVAAGTPPPPPAPVVTP